MQTIPEVITTTIKIPSMAVKARTMAGDIPFWIGVPTPNVKVLKEKVLLTFEELKKGGKF